MRCASRSRKAPERYASESYQHAVKLMDTADRYATEKHSSKKELIATSREAVQTAEDARAIAVKNHGTSESHRRAPELRAMRWLTRRRRPRKPSPEGGCAGEQ